MNRIKIKKIFFPALIFLLVLFCVTAGIYDFVIPQVISAFNLKDISECVGYPFISIKYNEQAVSASLSLHNSDKIESYEAKAVMLGVIPIKDVKINIYDRLYLYPGGGTFGVKLRTSGVLLVGMSEVNEGNNKSNPAYEAGLRIRDNIIQINGSDVNTISAVTEILNNCNGDPLRFTVLRDGNSLDFTLKPVYSKDDGTYKAGIWIRDSTAGIGTVTFIDPNNLQFGGLGHGICDVDTGLLLPLLEGDVTDVILNGIIKGQAGSPGELKGFFGDKLNGKLFSNTISGIYGQFDKLPEIYNSEPLPIALKDEIKEGDAYILSTDGSGGICKYNIKILNINRSQNSNENRNFIVEITDPKLLELTGGIVQGMSGSPIIQNEHICGAVTHVMINDPARGYGIFIENMLNTMQKSY